MRKRRGRGGFLNFVPKVDLGDLKFWGAKITLSHISPQFWTQGAESFLAIRGLGDTPF